MTFDKIDKINYFVLRLVLRAGLEPAHPKITDFKSVAATYYAIGAMFFGALGGTRTHDQWIMSPLL